MSTQLATLQGAAVPTVFHSLMQNMQSSELSQNVGARYAVLSFKGKVFRIKHDGAEHPITINLNGQEYAAPYVDVVIPMASPNLAKTYYTAGYTEGSDEAPTCWSEDGRNPLAPMENRPIVPATGQHCVDCAVCPMNVFGSKINETTGAKGKACADTRKLTIVPLNANGGVDVENARYGGPMLMRVPAASLSVFAEYDRKLQAMGIPYFAVVTRMQFDQTVAYPKFQLSPVRMITEAEANDILGLRNSPQVAAILDGGHASAPALAPPVQQVAPVTQALADTTGTIPGFAPPPAPTPVAAVQHVPPPAPTAVPAPAPAVGTAAPVQPAPVHVPPPAPVASPAPVQPAPVAPAPAPVASAPQPAFPGFPAPAQIPQAAPAQVAAPAAGPAPATVSQELLGRIDQLLDS